MQPDQQAERYKRELKFLQQEVKRIQTLHDQKDQELITLKKLKEPTKANSSLDTNIKNLNEWEKSAEMKKLHVRINDLDKQVSELK